MCVAERRSKSKIIIETESVDLNSIKHQCELIDALGFSSDFGFSCRPWPDSSSAIVDFLLLSTARQRLALFGITPITFMIDP